MLLGTCDIYKGKIGREWIPIKRKSNELVLAAGLLHIGDKVPETMATNDGDILMLEAPPESRPAVSSSAEVIDALPYIDDDYGDPNVKEEVDRLVEEEMRRSSKKPSDFLKNLPPLRKFNFEVSICTCHYFCSSILFYVNSRVPFFEILINFYKY